MRKETKPTTSTPSLTPLSLYPFIPARASSSGTGCGRGVVLLAEREHSGLFSGSYHSSLPCRVLHAVQVSASPPPTDNHRDFSETIKWRGNKGIRLLLLHFILSAESLDPVTLQD